MTLGNTDNDNRFDPTPGGSREALQSVMRLIRIAEYRQQTVMWILIACLATGAGYYALAKRYYRSEAKLMVIEQGGDDMSGMSDQAGVDDVMATHKELVRSPVVIQRAIDQLPPEHRVDLVDELPKDWVKKLSERLSATTIRKTNFIGVSYESQHPEAAAAVVRAIIDAYLAFVEENHQGTAAEVLNVLGEERDKLEVDLQVKQRKLRDSREQIGHLALPDKEDVVDPIIARAIKINDALMNVQQERVSLQASLATVQQAIHRGEDLQRYVGLVQETVGEQMMLSAMGLGENDMIVMAEQQKHGLELNAQLKQVRPFYGPSHPKVVALVEQINATEQYLASYRSGTSGRPNMLPNNELGVMLVTMLNQALNQASEKERQMEASFQIARGEAARQSGDLVRLDMLEREVERLERLHDVLFDKIATVDIHQVQAPVRVTIVQEPLPDDKPSNPRLQVVLPMTLVSGLFLGLAVAYLQDLSDDRFGSPEEMALQLGHRVLSVVRELKPLIGSGIETVQMYVNPQATESEAFRTLRTAIALGAEVSDRLVISSSEPSDGKTTISANLAVSYALSGKRTLVIDSDLRKPGMTALLDLKGKPGVTDILSSTGSIGEVAQRCLYRTPLENLHVIPAGPRRPDPAELLIGPNFAELLAWADGRYDQVLIDCPPILAVSDAQIVSRLVDGVILVVTPEKNHRRLVARACESFTNSKGTQLIGVVANRVSEQAGRGYGYGYGYGYGHEEEIDSTDLDNNPPRPVAA